MLSGLGVAHAQVAERDSADQDVAAAPAPAPSAAAPAGQQSARDIARRAAAAAAGQSRPAAEQQVVKSIRVEGSQRIEPETILSYTKLRVGEPYTNATIDQAIKDLYQSDFLSSVEIAGVETGNLVIRIQENPVINRVVLEGNKRLKDDKIVKEIKLAPRQIFTRTAVRADVARIIELYRREGRYAARIDPQMVKLDQNRVDVIFEIHEGPKSKVRQINIIGNEKFSDDDLRDEMATKQARWFRIFSSSTSFDRDRMQYDQQKLRQFYLTQGYADFRVVSAVAELTPDKQDFIITYVVEEGQRYKFGPVTVDSAIRDFDDEKLARSLPMKEGDWYNAKQVEDSIDQLSETAGFAGYAFADVQPNFVPDHENHTMAIGFNIAESQRTYVERVNINGNTQTQDEVIRREMRLAEGDPYNTFLKKRSEDRINSLGYFQDKFEIDTQKGTTDDRIVLNADVEEKPTGELSLSAGFSSLERFLVQAAVRQNNFRGMGQQAHIQLDYSSYSKSAEVGFTEPYLFDKPIALGGTIFRRDYNSFNYIGQDRNTTYSQVSTGFQIVSSIPLTEYWQLSGRYRLSQDDVSLDKGTFYRDTDGDGIADTCDPLRAGRYLCEAVGNRLTSSIGASLIYSSLNSYYRPTRGSRVVLGMDFAGVGGDVQYIRGRASADKYWGLGDGFIFSLSGEGGYIHALEDSPGPGVDAVRITDRFYLGQEFHGFDIRGVGPRVQRIPYTGTVAGGDQMLVTDNDRIVDDPLGGKAYYLGKAELEIPLGSGAQELGLRPSIYLQVGALFNIKRPLPTANFEQATDEDGNLLYNEDGSPSLLPIVTPVKDGSGRQLYVVPADAGDNGGSLTTCQVGYADSYGGACSGTSQNTVYSTTTAPFYERFVGDSASPRVSVGIGVNWNSPFGPLRIDLAKALVTQPGDDAKLITFNVGTQF
ncbi:outer membrane protein assembly factor BamA [Stakelama saccharophila]|uniref:Outer membrane protein assembly factor BamA n=2 Tax=Stakelama saccharophila TaxID=3075605 RepID=A0ABZ0BF94_9SPHN|nr:outer membrane protein assembly factor BamA [Stakelama sp. W311]WNO55149.1 outer membrane protein assembly factor BamA [Stakelama sp. W311]